MIDDRRELCGETRSMFDAPTRDDRPEAHHLGSVLVFRIFFCFARITGTVSLHSRCTSVAWARPSRIISSSFEKYTQAPVRNDCVVRHSGHSH